MSRTTNLRRTPLSVDPETRPPRPLAAAIDEVLTAFDELVDVDQEPER